MDNKDLSTLVEDMYNILDQDTDHVVSEDNLTVIADNIKNLLRDRFRKQERKRTLRFSNLGKPDRQLWYDINSPESSEKFLPKTLFKFLYGDLIEQLLLFLAKEAGHKVEYEQYVVEVEGIQGHLDAVIDGVVVDAKSASPYAYQKFMDGRFRTDDPFGYIRQISGYGNVVKPGQGVAFLVADKVHGDIGLAKVDSETVQQHPPLPRIEHLKKVVTSEELPPRCYPDVPEGKSGNKKLGVNCSYCAHKFKCWADANNGEGLRAYKYSTGPTFLTHVEREPKVDRITPF